MTSVCASLNKAAAKSLGSFRRTVLSEPHQPSGASQRTTRRRSRRTKSVVPVRFRIAGGPESHPAHPLNVTNHGVRLGGYRGEIRVGDEFVIQYRHMQAQFRVIWIAALSESLEKQIGAESLQPEKQLWGERFPEQADEYERKNDRPSDTSAGKAREGISLPLLNA